MGSRKDRRILGRVSAALRSDDTDLAAMFDEFARAADSPVPREARPRPTHPGRTAVVRPLAALVLFIGVVLIGATVIALSHDPTCTGPGFYPKSLELASAERGDHARVPARSSCQASLRTPAQPGTNRLTPYLPARSGRRPASRAVRAAATAKDGAGLRWGAQRHGRAQGARTAGHASAGIILRSPGAAGMGPGSG